MSKPAPRHLWVVGILVLLWDCMGALDFTMTQLQADWYMEMGEFTAEQLDYFYGLPLWLDIAWGAAVYCGLAGMVCLLMRKQAAVELLFVSLVGNIISSGYTCFFTNGLEMMGEGAGVFSAIIFVVCLGVAFYSLWMRTSGVLR